LCRVGVVAGAFLVSAAFKSITVLSRARRAEPKRVICETETKRNETKRNDAPPPLLHANSVRRLVFELLWLLRPLVHLLHFREWRGHWRGFHGDGEDEDGHVCAQQP
jgi:hypothetical protein